jgi:hypothetical protein
MATNRGVAYMRPKKLDIQNLDSPVVRPLMPYFFFALHSAVRLARRPGE